MKPQSLVSPTGRLRACSSVSGFLFLFGFFKGVYVMRFYVNFETDNAAFGESDDERDEEVARILDVIKDDLYCTPNVPHGVHDVNGNTIGTYGFKE